MFPRKCSPSANICGEIKRFFCAAEGQNDRGKDHPVPRVIDQGDATEATAYLVCTPIILSVPGGQSSPADASGLS